MIETGDIVRLRIGRSKLRRQFKQHKWIVINVTPTKFFEEDIIHVLMSGTKYGIAIDIRCKLIKIGKNKL